MPKKRTERYPERTITFKIVLEKMAVPASRPKCNLTPHTRSLVAEAARSAFFVLILTVFLVAKALAQSSSDFKGRSTCDEPLRNPPGSYGVRLDASQNAYLQARRIKGKYVLFAVRSQRQDEECGEITDVAESPIPDDYVLFECRNSKSPGDVVVGLWPHKRKAHYGVATSAWKVDLSTLQFIPIDVPVRCSQRGLRGKDEGGDLRQQAEKRIHTEKNPPGEVRF